MGSEELFSPVISLLIIIIFAVLLYLFLRQPSKESQVSCDPNTKPYCFDQEEPVCVQDTAENGREGVWQCNYYHLAPYPEGAIYPAFPTTAHVIYGSGYVGQKEICDDMANPYTSSYSYDSSCGFGTFNNSPTGRATVGNYGEPSPGDITGFRLHYENPNIYGFKRVNNVSGSTIFEEPTSSSNASSIDECEEKCINDKGDGSTNGQYGCYGYVYNPLTKSCNTHTLTSTSSISGSAKVLKNPSLIINRLS